MKRPPRDPKEPILNPYLMWRITFVAIILVIGTFGLFVWERSNGASIESARTIAVNTLVAFEMFYLFNTRYIKRTVLTRDGIFGNSYVLAAIGLIVIFQMGFTYLAPAQVLFDTRAIPLASWLRIGLVSISVLFMVEAEKYLFRTHPRLNRIRR